MDRYQPKGFEELCCGRLGVEAYEARLIVDSAIWEGRYIISCEY
jgi:hypothetical protein